MKLIDIRIENFRGIHSLYLPLDNLTVLIGENNTGKSTVLEAIRLVMTRGFGFRYNNQFNEYDFHLQDENASPESSDPILIILHFAEESEEEWPESLIQQLNEAIQLNPDSGINHIWLQAKGVYNVETATIDTSLVFLNKDGDEQPLKSSAPFSLISRFVPVFFLSALRDASQEFGQRGQFWGSFIKSLQLPEDQRKDIEESLNQINSSLINANEGLTEVIEKISQANRFVSLSSSSPVVIEAIPTRVLDMIGKLQLYLKTYQGVKLPLSHHGEGTQSLSVLMLFQAFTEVNLAESFTPESTPILALEEPEAHLHPSAIRSLGAILETMKGQIFVTSHSGNLISHVPITSLRRLYKYNGEAKVGLVGNNILSGREIQAIDYSIRFTKGHFLFSRCWLLVEGESDLHLLPLLLGFMGHSQDQINISVLEYSQAIDKGEPFVKLAKALGIEWFLIADGDPDGQGYVKRVEKYLGTGEILSDRARNLPSVDIEHEFWNNGFDDFIDGLIPASAKQQIETESSSDYTKKTKLSIRSAIRNVGGKPAFAQKLYEEITRRGIESIPVTISEMIEHVAHLSGG